MYTYASVLSSLDSERSALACPRRCRVRWSSPSPYRPATAAMFALTSPLFLSPSQPLHYLTNLSNLDASFTVHHLNHNFIVTRHKFSKFFVYIWTLLFLNAMRYNWRLHLWGYACYSRSVAAAPRRAIENQMVVPAYLRVSRISWERFVLVDFPVHNSSACTSLNCYG